MRRRRGTPYDVAAPDSAEREDSLVRCQTRRDLSREEETMVSELSIGVAIAVTASVWPLSTPLRTRTSAMAAGRLERESACARAC